MNNQEEIKYDFEIIQEANDESEIFKQTKRLLKHMLKYKFQPSEQGTSWINSINDANNRINIIINRSKGVWTRFYNNNYEINKCYNEALSEAVKETGLTYGDFPGTLFEGGEEFALSSIINRSILKIFLLKYLNKKREGIEDKIYNKFGG